MLSDPAVELSRHPAPRAAEIAWLHGERLGTKGCGSMLKCIEVTELSSQEMERALSLREQLSLRTHLVICSGCSNFRKQMKTLRQVMQAYADGGAVAPEPEADRTD